MENTQSVATLMESTSSKIQQLQKAFAELESQRAVTLNLKWKQLEEHFHGLENSLKRRFIALEDQEKEFQRKTMEAQDSLQKREADVMAKERASLARLEERRNAALLAISSVLGKRKFTPCMDSSDIRVGQGEAPILEEIGPDCKVAKTDSEDTRNPVNSQSTEVISYPDLVKLCEDMDAKGLHKFISDNRKNLAAIREEIPLALRVAADPARLVINSLEGFYCTEGTNVDGKKDASLLGLRRTCIMLMECLSILLSNPALISDSDIISEDNKVKARAVAEEWKPMLDALDMDASNGNSLEAHAYLQLIATFNITSDFDQEDISRFLPMVSRRRQTADLCRALGLSEKMPGVIEVLVNSGRQIDAVNLAFAFELTEKFPPVSLLKSFLKEARKTSSPAKAAGASPTVQNEVNDCELTALKAVMKCIEEHKLEEHYLLEPLQKRVLQIEKAKADKKRATEAAKPQSKRPRANVVGNVPRVSKSAADKTFYSRTSDRYAQKYMYDRPYVYTGPTDNFCPKILSSGTYSITPPHGNYFASGYQYQVAAPYLH